MPSISDVSQFTATFGRTGPPMNRVTREGFRACKERNRAMLRLIIAASAAVVLTTLTAAADYRPKPAAPADVQLQVIKIVVMQQEAKPMPAGPSTTAPSAPASGPVITVITEPAIGTGSCGKGCGPTGP